jgi:hypothetical protein
MGKHGPESLEHPYVVLEVPTDQLRSVEQQEQTGSLTVIRSTENSSSIGNDFSGIFAICSGWEVVTRPV